jgi:hypothetical protein
MKLLVLVLLSGCQLIISHDDFGAASDAELPSDTQSDAPLANAVTTPATVPMVIAGVQIGFTSSTQPTILAQDGNWVEQVVPEGDYVAKLVLADVFASAPRCFCEAFGGGNIDCSLTKATTTSAVSVGVWRQSQSELGVLCVGEAKTGSAGELQFAGQGLGLLASARFDSQAHALAQDGSWIGGTTTLSNGNPGATFITPFVELPACDYNAVAQDLITSKGHFLPTKEVTSPFLSPGDGSVSASSIMAICLGGIGGSGSAVVSPSNTGARFATATIGADGQIESSDGDWLTSTSPLPPPPDDERLTIKTGTFSGPPRCTCTLESPNFFEGDLCGIHAEPTTNQLMIRRYNIENGAARARRAHVACLRD